MGLRDVIPFLGAMLPALLPAQAAGPAPAPLAARILRVPDLSQFDAGAPQEKSNALARFVEVVRQVPIQDRPARSLTLSTGQSASGPVLLARGTTEQIDTVDAALAQLRRVDAVTTRLQCSLVTMPLAVARAHRLEPGRTTVTDHAVWTELQRDAVNAKGKVHNLTEVVVGALAPFVREPAATAGVTRVQLRLRGEVVPLSADEVALALEVSSTPAGEKQAPSPVATPVFRLAAGKSAMMMSIDGDSALVVIVRCLEVGVAVGK